MAKKTLEDCPPETLADEIVVVRVDYNLPLDQNGEVVDHTRLLRTLPTIQYLVEAGAKAVLLSHLGRPGGRPDQALSLRAVAEKLEKALGSPVGFCPATTGPLARDAVQGMESGDVLLLENTRFCPEDTRNDPEWAEEIRYGSKLFVNDAFGTAHRTHASTKGIADAVRAGGGEAVAGFLLEKELRFLCDALADPEHPFVAVIGGAKISSKIDVIEALLPAVDRLLIGGAMANTFFKAHGWAVGDSLVEENRLDTARSLMDLAGVKLLLPMDVVTAPCLVSGATTRVCACGRSEGGRTHRRYRARVGEILRRRPECGPHRPMEWTDGRFRAGAIPGGHIRGRTRRRLDGRSGCNGHRRGGRFRSGRGGGAGRRSYHAHLDRWQRFPRTPLRP